MPHKRPIRLKVVIGLGLLLLMVVILAGSGLFAAYSYRGLARDLRARADELPVASDLSRQVSELQLTLTRLRVMQTYGYSVIDRNEATSGMFMLRDEFRIGLAHVDETLSRYRALLEDKLRDGSPMSDNRREWETVHRIESTLAQVHRANAASDWMLDAVKIEQLETELESLQSLAAELPSHLYQKLAGFVEEVRGQYRMLLVTMWVTSAVAAVFFLLFLNLFYKWVFQPLGVLITGSRRVAAGEFNYRIRLETDDEMAELARAMNDMTARFRAIRDDLDNQVAERTRQVVRNEQLAGVGFLAAGVAHEINNPLASIAMCSESLERRVRSLLKEDDGEHEVIGNYLRMIQSEAFRCKEITERLLDFSRGGDSRRQETDVAELVDGVIEMVGHLKKYQGRRIDFRHEGAVAAVVNPQEIKQVVLNLLSNALDSCEDGGRVDVALASRDGCVTLTVADDGCGMEPQVLEHIFEPFYTQKRPGQGTGLGLSITHRIVADHGGDIQASSRGRGKGAVFTVRIPVRNNEENAKKKRQAA